MRTEPVRAVFWSGAVAVLLAVGYLAAPPMGTDLSAQVARAHFFAAFGAPRSTSAGTAGPTSSATAWCPRRRWRCWGYG